MKSAGFLRKGRKRKESEKDTPSRRPVKDGEECRDCSIGEKKGWARNRALGEKPDTCEELIQLRTGGDAKILDVCGVWVCGRHWKGRSEIKSRYLDT